MHSHGSFRQSTSPLGAPRGLARLLAASLLGAALTSGAARAADDDLPASVASSKTVTFCSSLSQPPLEFVDQNQNPVGSDIELGNALAKSLGLKTKWINIPFSGLIPALQAGQCNAIMSQLFIKPQRLEVIDELPYMYSQEILIFKKGATVADDPVDMSGKKVATVTGTTATVLLEDANKKLKAAGKPLINIVEFPTGTAAFQQLVIGQVDAYGAAYEIGTYYDKQNPDEIVAGSKPFYKILTGIGIRKDEPGLSKAFEKQLAALMKDGTYQAIFKKWDLATDMLSGPMPTQPVKK
ncbi:ABC transporter substrate-binding protein [Jiella sp. M17.18]|uniref:ABC transporter substrate-binding protein n=1 Tax=Jiella sp. M17.18 TaxID=3234247 RepID=UPI0034DF165B